MLTCLVVAYTTLYMSARDQLKAFLDERDVRPGTFARQIGYDRANFHKLLKPSGHKPSLDLAAEIERATGGAVPAALWADAA